jgi:hypothetical protein
LFSVLVLNIKTSAVSCGHSIAPNVAALRPAEVAIRASGVQHFQDLKTGHRSKLRFAICCSRATQSKFLKGAASDHRDVLGDREASPNQLPLNRAKEK